MRWMFALMGVMFAGVAAHAADTMGHALFHDSFYQELRKPGTKLSCCDDRDCRPVEHKATPNGVMLLVGSHWLRPPDDAIIYKMTPDGGAHWCGFGAITERPHTRCAIIPVGGV